MPTTRGFVQKIEIGRAGLVRIFLIDSINGNLGIYVIQDLDADPERFNERLSTLGILRDALNRAEPVELEYVIAEAGNEIQTTARLSRNALAPLGRLQTISGFVVRLLVHSENGTTGTEEKHDHAKVHLISGSVSPLELYLDLQAPERLVVNEQLEMLREAQVMGYPVQLLIDGVNLTESEDTPDTTIPSATAAERVQARETGRIVAVAIDPGFIGLDRDRLTELDGFVESLGLIQLPELVDEPLASTFAYVKFTTAPTFSGSGNIVGLEPFMPATIDLLTLRNSQTYNLLEAGLRDNRRMRVSAVLLRQPNPSPAPDRPDTPDIPQDPLPPVGVAAGSDSETSLPVSQPFARLASESRAIAAPSRQPPTPLGLAMFAELFAPLASASRPVWIMISRASLDYGPDGSKCAEGLPTSDLTPRSLRDLRIPYPAVWQGVGCFNPGVYRFELTLPSPYTISVDGKPLCLYDATQTGIKLAHACLHGEHEVTVEIKDWICDYEFAMDVYRIR